MSMFRWSCCELSHEPGGKVLLRFGEAVKQTTLYKGIKTWAWFTEL